MAKRKLLEVTEPEDSAAKVQPTAGHAPTKKPSEAPPVVPPIAQKQSNLSEPSPDVLLSAETISLLKHFLEIREKGIVLRSGKILSSRSVNKVIYADAQIQEEFPKTAPIYSIEAFVQQLSYFQRPILHFGDTQLTITDASDTGLLAYRPYDDVEMCEQPYKVALPSVFDDVQFDLAEGVLHRLLGIAKASGAQELAVQADGRHLELLAQVRNDHASDSAQVVARLRLGDAPKGRRFTFVLYSKYVTLLPGAYHVAVNRDGLIRFSNRTRPIIYHICLEANRSTYTEDQHNG